MSGDQGSGYEWRRKRGGINKALERIEDTPWNLFSGRGPLTDSAKRKLYETGTPGHAEILKAPGEHSFAEAGSEMTARFRVRVELPGRDPYEVKLTQSIWEGNEREGLKEGAWVECRVDPKNEKRVLLLAPEPDELKLTVMDSSEILARGHRAAATVVASEPLGKTAPGTEDPFFHLKLEVRSESEPRPWTVQIGQRVPKGAEQMVEPGRELTIAYLEVDEGDSAAVDWPGSTGGRFS